MLRMYLFVNKNQVIAKHWALTLHKIDRTSELGILNLDVRRVGAEMLRKASRGSGVV